MLMQDSGQVLGPTPMQSFKGSNFAGVPQPKLFNDSKAFNYEAESATPANEHMHILLFAAAFIAGGYILWHALYER